MKKRIVCITGGANGIGKSLVEHFSELGDVVHFFDKDREGGERLEREQVKMGYSAVFHHTDVASHEEIKNGFQAIRRNHDSLDVLINNAGISKFKSFWEMTPEDWNTIISANLSSVFHCSREAAGLMKDKGGTIINIASTRARMSEPHTEAYSASKGGIASLTHSLAITLGEYKIRVNSISPGWIETGDYSALREIDHSQHPSGRVGKPEDIARTCRFLADPENDFITGENLVVDGGMTRKMIYEH
ncbi:SDR family NAD(P)-dependent oxidoreductase [Rossellomorea aquimaris]|jgi:NAD(P)-dependent dehydrogenase (short-subunit alcohol dehydrogenase family)|uniref:Oxidoreductase n=1 Tax=Rossellomorea aquimaris TaxID=189382 RepID=A0A1J6W470_9BACI|nr:SDR family oxidoreductase [Rossellomorea aquimaris]OIU72421.1 oxidoreductase [Rossellomorea aquimaris]